MHEGLFILPLRRCRKSFTDRKDLDGILEWKESGFDRIPISRVYILDQASSTLKPRSDTRTLVRAARVKTFRVTALILFEK